MNTTTMIRRVRPVLVLGLSLSACLSPLPVHEPFGLGDEGTSLELPGNITTIGVDPDSDTQGDAGTTSDGDTETVADGDTGTSTHSDSSGDGDPASCGNGQVELGEDCDDDNSDPLDGCLNDCRQGPIGIEIDPTNPTPLPLQGNLAGGDPFDDACPEGQVIIGIEGNSGQWMDRVQIVCGVLQLSENEGQRISTESRPLALSITPGTVLPSRGGPGGFPYSAVCPEDYVVTGFGGRAGSSWVYQLIVRCTRLLIDDDGISLSIGVDQSLDLDPVGGSGGVPFPLTDCGPGEVATIGNIRAQQYVDAFGLTCMPLQLAF
ncbi:MAG: hypothetical protein K0V04_25435 [Deltaproteobacteria bacterium]|nr:hypothetical protein [Deltaproteobacteria bacterium]